MEGEEEDGGRIGRHNILDSDVDSVLLYGSEMKIAYEYASNNTTNKNLFYTDNYDLLKEEVEKSMSKDSIIMLKGSRGMALERTVDDIFGTWYHEEFERDGRDIRRTGYRRICYRRVFKVRCN